MTSQAPTGFLDSLYVASTGLLAASLLPGATPQEVRRG